MKTQLKIVVKAVMKNNSEYDFMISYQTCIIDFLGHCSVVSVIFSCSLSCGAAVARLPRVFNMVMV